MKRFFTGIWVSIACVAVMILTANLIVLFYIATFFRKLFYKDFVPNYLKDESEEHGEERIGSASAQAHAVQRMLEKEQPSS